MGIIKQVSSSIYTDSVRFNPNEVIYSVFKMCVLAIVQLLFFVLKSRCNLDLLRVLTRRPRAYEALCRAAYIYKNITVNNKVKCCFPLSEQLKENFRPTQQSFMTTTARSVCYTSLRHRNFQFQFSVRSSVDGLVNIWSIYSDLCGFLH